VFLRNSFSPVSFSSTSFDGATASAQDGRSGYWRLFFTQLQEESNKPKAAVESATSEKVENRPKRSPKATTIKTEKRAIRPPEEPEIVPPFRPLPMYERRADEPTYLQQMWNITAELRIMVASLHQSTVKFNHELDVANDEDDIELLLLVM